jgi:hypothetical protein
MLWHGDSCTLEVKELRYFVALLLELWNCVDTI